MPYISIESGELSSSQKEDLIRELTKKASEIMHVPESFFSVTIKELPNENFGIGGKNIGQIKAEYAKKQTK